VPSQVVVVAGLPGSGKTTLARALAQSTRLPLIRRDAIKEALGSTLDVTDVEGSRQLGAASYDVLFAIAAEVPGPLIIESNFGAASVPAIAGLALVPPVQVFCRCPLDVAAARCAQRPRHPVHHTPAPTVDELAAMGPIEPLSLDGALIEVDTSGPVDLDGVLEQLSSALR
jgi:cytidylate kinase